MTHDLRAELEAALRPSHAIDRELGGGGMSRVFLAEEVTLGRKVVIKVLPRELAADVSLERFKREIAVAARLQHPHIVPLLSVGDVGGLPYFTMPFVAGESLRARLVRETELPVADVVRIMREVATALAHAHANGVVHRDIKPDNVLLSGGVAMVTDFGVAKAIDLAATAEDSARSGMTSLGVALGTPAYMAPEQASADPHVDQRVDIYALGVMAYEMLSGRPPFNSPNPARLLAAHVSDTPVPVVQHRPSMPPALGALVMQCLEKRPADRPQSAADLVRALDAIPLSSGGHASAVPRHRARVLVAVGGAIALAAAIAGARTVLRRDAAPAVAIERIALLPLENRTGDTTQAYFAEGITREIISALIRGGLPTTGFASVARYAGRDSDYAAIARDLRVQRIAAGVLLRLGGQVQLNLELSDPASGVPTWTNRYAIPEGDISLLAERVATDLVRSTQGTQTATARQGDAAAVSPDAYRAYLLGLTHLGRYTNPDFLRAIEALRRATTLDSSFAAAYGVLALAYMATHHYGFMPLQQAHSLSEAAITRALELNPRSGIAHAAKASLQASRDWNWTEAERSCSQAIALEPTPWVYNQCATLVLLPAGRLEQAVALLEKAAVLDPQSATMRSDYAGALSWAGRRDAALEQWRTVLALDPAFAEAYVGLAAHYSRIGAADSALRAVAVYDSLAGGTMPHMRGVVLARLGREQEARRIAAELERRAESGEGTYMGVPNIYGVLGDVENAIRVYERAIARRELPYPYQPAFDNLWHDARFRELFRRIGLPPKQTFRSP